MQAKTFKVDKGFLPREKISTIQSAHSISLYILPPAFYYEIQLIHFAFATE